MKPITDSRKKYSFPLQVGSIVIAQPFWSEQIYKHAIVLITDHGNNGTRGIIINKVSNIRVNELMNDPDIKIDKLIYFGGTHSLERISFLHNIPHISEADYFGNGIYYGGDPMSVEELIRTDKIDFSKIKFFAGFTEWEHGELEWEIKNNKWWISEIDERELFHSAPEQLWSEKLLLIGNIYGLFSEECDPSLS